MGVEKAGIVERGWFGDLGVPILALGGYASQSYVDAVAGDARGQDRPTVPLYAGVLRSRGAGGALGRAQVDEHRLPPQLGKAADSRAAAFVARHGRLVQVELDALPPDVLRELYADALDEFYDVSKYGASVEREELDRAELAS